MFKKWIVVVMASFLLLGQISYAATVGYIDVQKVFLGYKVAQKLSEEFEQKQKDLKAEYEAKEAEVLKAIRDGKSQTEVDALKKKIRDDLEPKQETLAKFNQTSTQKIREDIIAATKVVAKDVGLTVVLDQKVFIIGGIDLTDLVLKKLNKR